MDIVNRLKEYMEYVGMPSTQFADMAKVPRPTISQILNGRNRKISNELIAKLHDAFPTLNIMWLLFGDGDIEIDPNTQISERQNSQNQGQKPQQPIINQIPGLEDTTNHNDRIPLRSSNIEEFMAENRLRQPQNVEMQQNVGSEPGLQSNIQQIATHGQLSQKKIQSIMVFYNDNSYEIFTPSI